MTEDGSEPGPPDAEGIPEAGPESPKDQEAWKLVYFGQLSRDLVPYHPDPPEAPEDELTQMAMTDPDNVIQFEGEQERAPNFWRVLTVVAVAIGALALVFWHRS